MNLSSAVFESADNHALARRSVLITSDALGLGGAEAMLVNLANHFDSALISCAVLSMSTDNPLPDRLPMNRIRFITAQRHVAAQALGILQGGIAEHLDVPVTETVLLMTEE